MHLEPVPIELQLMEPLVGTGRLGGLLRQLGVNKTRKCLLRRIAQRALERAALRSARFGAAGGRQLLTVVCTEEESLLRVPDMILVLRNLFDRSLRDGAIRSFVNDCEGIFRSDVL